MRKHLQIYQYFIIIECGVISISQRILLSFTILFGVSYFLTGCIVLPVALLTVANSNHNHTSKPQSQHSDERAELVRLRSSYSNLSVAEVQAMQHITIRKNKKWGFYGYSTIKHDYVSNTIGDDKVVIDHATELMWHQSGSTYGMNWEKAKRWVNLLNKRGYAGYHDWRLPTVEEAASLLEPNKKKYTYLEHKTNERKIHDRFVDSIFDMTQGWIWTGDNYYRLDAAWRVDFFSGLVDWDIYYYAFYHVRPVRTIKL